jgi:hypothetical protein
MTATPKPRKAYELLLVSPAGQRVPSRFWASRKSAEVAAEEMRTRYKWHARVQERLL